MVRSVGGVALEKTRKGKAGRWFRRGGARTETNKAEPLGEAAEDLRALDGVGIGWGGAGQGGYAEGSQCAAVRRRVLRWKPARCDAVQGIEVEASAVRCGAVY